jgi:hypothetical protein
MTTQSTTATFLGRSGKVYTFENTAVTDGTAGEEMLSGPSPYALTAQSLGDYAQDDVLIAGLVTAQTNAGVAYISYGGEIVATLPISAFSVTNEMQSLVKPVMIHAGMVVLKQPIECAYVTGPADTTAAPNGAIFVNGAGTPVGNVPLSLSSKAQPKYTKFKIPIDLNTVAQVVADA